MTLVFKSECAMRPVSGLKVDITGFALKLLASNRTSPDYIESFGAMSDLTSISKLDFVSREKTIFRDP